MIADAFARISGVRVLALDRMDVLDSNGRSDALNWLREIADSYDTLIVAATLKSPPQINGVNTIWLGEEQRKADAA